MKFLIPLFCLILSSAAHSSGFEQRADDLKALPTLHNGPNCWNTSMIVLGAIDNYRFVSLEEFEYYLSRHCEPLKKMEELSYGHLIVETDVVQGYWGVIDHSFVYFSGELAFSKDSRYPADKPHYDSFKEAFVFSNYNNFSTQEPKEGDSSAARPYRCDFTVKPEVPIFIRPILEMFHKINTGQEELTVVNYKSLVAMADQVRKIEGKSRYTRVLEASIGYQIKFYRKALELVK